MEEQVLTVEQMQQLIDMGIDVSKASCYWFKHVESDMGWSLFTRKPADGFDYIPTFTLHDVINVLPSDIDNEYEPCLHCNYRWEVRRYVNGFNNLVTIYIGLCEDTKEHIAKAPYPDDGDIIFVDTLRDAAFEMLVWYKKHNYI